MTDRIYRFAEFELRLAESELCAGNITIRLQEKPLLLLSTLLDHSQKLVSREQLRERMWASDTFVDYEQGINVAIKKIRSALGDSAENPRFIQTVAKKGYKFLLSVEVKDSDFPAPLPIELPAKENHSEQQTLPPAARYYAHRLWLLIGFAAASLLAIGLWLFYGQSARAHYPAPIHSLAVLPLRNLSPDPGQDYFADGITEELITNLAQSLPLRVISRTSVMRYKQTNEPIGQIARELGVEAIIEGAVARVGNRVTVTVQLIDAREDRHLWARKYNRDMKDMLAVEAEVSQQISSQVGGALTSHHIVEASLSRPIDSRVYELCLLGRYHWNRRTAADLDKAAEYYQQAIARDPQYAPAYAGLANAYALMPSYGSVELQSAYRRAEDAAHRALQLDENLADAHATLGIIYLNSRDWQRAGPELQRALDLSANYATAHHWYAFYLFFSGHKSEALSEIEQARQLDPLSAVIYADEGGFLYGMGRYAEAKVRLRQAIELAPDFGQPHETLGLTELETGNPSVAFKEAQAGLMLDRNNPRTIGEAGYVLAATGHNDDARKLLLTLNDMVLRGSSTPTFEALIQLGLGNRGAALDELEHAASVMGIEGLSQWRPFDQLGAEPRYQKLTGGMAKVKSPNLAMAH
ncbi:MAG TPA: winged helix-turn-helix domain-containing protein [Terriglobales bacterium]|nr:winged helix-turn-helix domain-containing protein [Terriglobales bacterium]